MKTKILKGTPKSFEVSNKDTKQLEKKIDAQNAKQENFGKMAKNSNNMTMCDQTKK